MARNFNGGTDQITWTDPVAPGNVGCVAFWLRTTQVTVNVSLVSHWSATSREGWGIIMNSAAANKVEAQGWSGTTARVDIWSTTSVNDGNPHHIAFNFNRANGGSNQLYVDGAQEASMNSTNNWNTINATPIRMAKEPSFWAAAVADMWELGYWLGSQLTADEIAALAKGFSPKLIKPANLRLYAPLVREVGDRRNGLTASVTGTTVVPHGRVIGGAI